jgi:predicted restriction endonuclease
MNYSWTREQLLIAFKMYCQIPFGKLHSRNPEIIKVAKLINRTPSALAMKLSNIASLDPSITSTGRHGLTGASNADRAIWSEMKNDWNSFVSETAKAEHKLGLYSDKSDLTENTATDDNVSNDIDYTGKSNLSTINIRIGQQFFRKSVLSAYNSKCSISGLSVPELLIASHIVPWSTDDKNRLNPRNGICLSVIHDKAFDIGIITITDKMTVKVADDYLMGNFTEDNFLVNTIIKYDGISIKLPEKFSPEQEFLHYHRNSIFKGKI